MRKPSSALCQYCGARVRLLTVSRREPVRLAPHADGWTVRRRDKRDCDGSGSTMFKVEVEAKP